MSEIKAGKLQAGISVTPANNFVLDPSADDGTLILRDSSGTALMTMVSGGEAETYARDNILGTVSQSGGVPTGAIIESGSNANGVYTKFADGTMICTRLMTVANLTNRSVTIANTTGGHRSGENGFNFPSTFITTPAIATSMANNANGLMVRAHSTAGSAIIVLYSSVTTAPSPPTGDAVSYLAIGRWF